MGRPGALCGLCPDSRINRRFTSQECYSCFGVRFCDRHITFVVKDDKDPGRWLCKRCARNEHKRDAKAKEV